VRQLSARRFQAGSARRSGAAAAPLAGAAAGRPPLPPTQARAVQGPGLPQDLVGRHAWRARLKCASPARHHPRQGPGRPRCGLACPQITLGWSAQWAQAARPQRSCPARLWAELCWGPLAHHATCQLVEQVSLAGFRQAPMDRNATIGGMHCAGRALAFRPHAQHWASHFVTQQRCAGKKALGQSLAMRACRAVVGSLVATARRREAARVAAGNGALLVRLAAVRGAYSASAWAAAAAAQARRGGTNDTAETS